MLTELPDEFASCALGHEWRWVAGHHWWCERCGLDWDITEGTHAD